VLDAIRVRVDPEHLSCRVNAKDPGTLHCLRIVHLLDGAVGSAQEAQQRGGTRDVGANAVLYVTRDCSRRIDGRGTGKGPKLRGVKRAEDTIGSPKEDAKIPISGAKTMSDPITISFIGVIALLGQARDSNPSYGQGLSGYAKRHGTFYADTGIGTLMKTSVFPTLLHQDPRYFQLGSGGVWHRTKYSVSRIFVTRADNGERQFNYSEIAGNAVAAGISNTYHPRNQRTLSDTLSVWGTNIMLNAVCNVAKEFWPDLRQKLHKSKAD